MDFSGKAILHRRHRCRRLALALRGPEVVHHQRLAQQPRGAGGWRRRPHRRTGRMMAATAPSWSTTTTRSLQPGDQQPGRWSRCGAPQLTRPDPSNDSVPLDNWRFIAVTYDATQAAKQVRYYIGSGTERAILDSAADCACGALGHECGGRAVHRPHLPVLPQDGRRPHVPRHRPGADLGQRQRWLRRALPRADHRRAGRRRSRRPACALRAQRPDGGSGAGRLAPCRRRRDQPGRTASPEDLHRQHHDLGQNAPPGGRRPGNGASACTGEQHPEPKGGGLDPENLTLMAWVPRTASRPAAAVRRRAGQERHELEAGHFALHRQRQRPRLPQSRR